uniref:Cytochrome c554 and c-prime n=1 Tax=Candidatus Kentrum sp. FM TaxID=2126340 RepID=A0A450TBW4_9GAMM|nr:MAG: Cytochrome c554 and c-prime [Candidatus Kentron sp. FM]VFJ64993.1 MAG: Cytochrome c554 and c-prime [Candidatus Kentron sp. FM]VFK16269.1 MAG: Cytochrome c554 and c-prime [Candidatus Kentron sp. FM]
MGNATFPLSPPLRPPITPGLRKFLFAVFVFFAVLGADSVYLAGITALEWVTGRILQNHFYQLMFLMHLALGFIGIVPVVIFGLGHGRNAWAHRNRRAVRAGLALFATVIGLLVSGIALTRLGAFELKDPRIREALYWVHAVAPLVAIWLFVLHRLAGGGIRWRLGVAWVATALGFSILAILIGSPLLHHEETVSSSSLRRESPGPGTGDGRDDSKAPFFPSLAKTAHGGRIPAKALMRDDYCQRCHADVHEQWSHSAHRLSSFNNPAYRFSVRETGRVSLETTGDYRLTRFCAGCHDPVPLFSGALEKADFDDRKHPTANAGITCTSCHAITRIDSPRGNGDYTIANPRHYPFTDSANPLLQWVNHQLIKAKPAFHKATFLKPLHKDPAFCGTCHKVHIPQAVNQYKWLRGQNHQDSYHLSGVSGHGASSFYYPDKAIHRCSACHMPPTPSDDFGAAFLDGPGQPVGRLKVHNHLFPAANTALAQLLDLPSGVIEAHREFLRGALRVDIFGIKEDGRITGELIAPLRPSVPVLIPGRRYLLEVVIRTVRLGHLFTQGTADSNQIWLEVTASSGGKIIGRSGALESEEGRVDPWSHFVNAYVLDRHGNRIDRRNAQDIFTPLYNHQIPPGAADVIHFDLAVPVERSKPVTVTVKLQYRKFDTTYLKHFQGDDFDGNDLPIITIAKDTITFPVVEAGAIAKPEMNVPLHGFAPPTWERWNDYGIGLLRKGNKGSTKGELRQAEQAFIRVERLGRADGPLNLARVYLKEGRLTEAGEALRRAARHDDPASPWVIEWLTGLVNKQNGQLDDAIDNFIRILDTDFPEARRREFDFSQDYRVRNELGQTLFERAKRERGQARRERRVSFLDRARDQFLHTLELDPENVAAHYNLALIHGQLGDRERAATHRALHMKYKTDDNARERTVALHRQRNPAADHTAESVVIYPLQDTPSRSGN